MTATRKDGSSSRSLVWWIDPLKFLLLITLPAFLISSAYGEEVATAYGIGNFISLKVVLLGCLSIFAIAAGIRLGEIFLAGKVPNTRYHHKRYNYAAFLLTSLAIISHLVLIGNILANFDVVIAAMAGSRGAIYQVKDNMVKITGVTSFTQLYLISLPLYAAYRGIFDRPPPKTLSFLVAALVLLVFIRAFVTLERFAIVEAALVLALPLVAYGSLKSRVLPLLPAFGFISIYLLFAAGEFTRSWPYYQGQYDSFWQFVNIRLLGYITTATNNASGLFETEGALFSPHYTAAWLRKVPMLESIGITSNENPMDAFFATHATAEFNNPGGILSGLLDYGPGLYLIYYISIGIITGLLFNQFKKRGAYALTYFPGWYLGFPVLTQAVYWGDPRFVLVTVGAPLVAAFITSPKRSL